MTDRKPIFSIDFDDDERDTIAVGGVSYPMVAIDTLNTAQFKAFVRMGKSINRVNADVDDTDDDETTAEVDALSARVLGFLLEGIPPEVVNRLGFAQRIALVNCFLPKFLASQQSLALSGSSKPSTANGYHDFKPSTAATLSAGGE